MTHYSRAEIGLRPPTGRYLLDRAPVQGVALHWPGEAEPVHGVPAVMKALRDWQRYHMVTRGWSDIAYQLAVDQAGNSYGLRGLRYRSAANGDEDVNRTHGAILLVLAEGEEPTPAMITQVQRKVGSFYHRFPNAREVVGHLDIRPSTTGQPSTECPGPAVEKLIKMHAFTPATTKEIIHP